MAMKSVDRDLSLYISVWEDMLTKVANQLDSDAQMFKFLGIIQLNNDGATNVVLPRVNWQLNNIFVGILNFPEFIPSRRVQQHVDGGWPTEAKKRSDFILRQWATLPYLKI